MYSVRTWAKPGALALAMGLAFLGNSPRVDAAVVSWLGGTPCDLANPANWQGNALPLASDEADFGSTGCHNPTSDGTFSVRYIV
jgi:hypothetical protein